MEIPASYVNGYNAARRRDPEFAEAYIRHTTVGDPLADRVVEELVESTPPGQMNRIISAALNNHENLPKNTPESLRTLIAEAAVIPDWFDQDIALIATEAFLRNPEIILAGLATGAIVEGFSTLISKSFLIRGRIIGHGVRRLKQNNLHLLEQFIPGGLYPGGDGWKLNLRIRLVHAQSRRLIKDSEEWDETTYGMPLSAAHMLLGAAAFSGRLMQHVERLGGDFNAEEREAYVHVWRYTGLVMGIPDAIMFHDEASACRAFVTGVLCEPLPEDDEIIMANSIINSAPIVLGFTEPRERCAKAESFYQVSRELIGNYMADLFRFPAGKRIRILPFMRLKYCVERVIQKLYLRWFHHHDFTHFDIILKTSNLGKYEISYKLPTALHDEDETQEW